MNRSAKGAGARQRSSAGGITHMFSRCGAAAPPLPLPYFDPALAKSLCDYWQN
ncbi:MAG: hypothetical protein LBU85_09715 [Treponema sp.]|nr:hypothetical protein [Treponema sp.]